jgi:microcystin-dependent protein
MSNAYIGEIRPFGFSFAPRNWATCDGQLLNISQFTALFAIIGTYYGGNGTTNFALPNMTGRTGVHQGQGQGLSQYVIGEMTGSSAITLLSTEIPMHNHGINTKAAGTTTQSQKFPTPAAFLGGSNPDAIYNDATPSPATPFAPQAIGIAGQGMPHDNLQPLQALLFCIAIWGIFPSRN